MVAKRHDEKGCGANPCKFPPALTYSFFAFLSKKYTAYELKRVHETTCLFLNSETYCSVTPPPTNCVLYPAPPVGAMASIDRERCNCSKVRKFITTKNKPNNYMERGDSQVLDSQIDKLSHSWRGYNQLVVVPIMTRTAEKHGSNVQKAHTEKQTDSNTSNPSMNGVHRFNTIANNCCRCPSVN